MLHPRHNVAHYKTLLLHPLQHYDAYVLNDNAHATYFSAWCTPIIHFSRVTFFIHIFTYKNIFLSFTYLLYANIFEFLKPSFNSIPFICCLAWQLYFYGVWYDIYLSIYNVSIYLSIYLSICLSIYLSIYLSIFFKLN